MRGLHRELDGNVSSVILLFTNLDGGTGGPAPIPGLDRYAGKIQTFSGEWRSSRTRTIAGHFVLAFRTWLLATAMVNVTRNILAIMVLSSCCFCLPLEPALSCAYRPHKRQGPSGTVNAVHRDAVRAGVRHVGELSGWMAIEVGDSSVAIVPEGVKLPVMASMVYIETLPSVADPVQFAT